MSRFFTTPIYYPNDRPHLGTAYPTVAADIAARWARLCGEETFLLTGTDEHGKKIEQAALGTGKKPQQFVDELSGAFKATFERLHISHDRFIRTTDADHVQVVQAIVQRIYDRGDIYKDLYRGPYCIDCESYYKEDDLLDGDCPIHRKPVTILEEEGYFFRLSRYATWLLAHIEANPRFITPVTRRNEVVSFIKQGLDDFAISRSSFRWGIPIPFDNQHITYVWFDALLNYITGIGYLRHPEHFNQFWPTSTHIIGKDILRFHAVYWPAMLKSAGIEPPKRIVAHGFWTVNGRKFSKSLGQVIRPEYLINAYGLDPLRYYMLREFSFGSDGDFSETNLVQRNNGELANGLGNLLQRAITLIIRYREGVIPMAMDQAAKEPEHNLAAVAHRTVERVSTYLDDFAFKEALETIWTLVHHLNAYINTREPWKIARRGEETLLDTVLSHLAEGLRFLSVLLYPFIPQSAETLAGRLGLSTVDDVASLTWKNHLGGQRVQGGAILFPKLALYTEAPPPPIVYTANADVLNLGIPYCIAQINDVKVRNYAHQLEQRKRDLEQKIRAMGHRWTDDVPEVQAYHRLYEKVGREPGEILTPIDVLSAYLFAPLLGRLPQINTIVDLYNIYSLTTFLSIGAHDRQKIRGGIRLEFAESPRSYLPVGMRVKEQVLPGEYYWRDDEHVLCRLDIKQSEATKVDENTRHIVLIVQGNEAIPAEKIYRDTEALCLEIAALCGGTYHIIGGSLGAAPNTAM